MMMLKRLLKQRKHFFPFPTESNKKTGRLLSENGRPETIAKTGRFPAKTGGLESLSQAQRILLNSLRDEVEGIIQ